MSKRAILRSAGLAGALWLCLSTAAPAAERDANASGREPPAVSLRLDTFVRIVLINHPELEVAAPDADPDRKARPTLGTQLVVWAPTGGEAAEAKLRRRVDTVLFQATEAYWEQVLRLEDVQLRERALAEAAATARGVNRGAGKDTSALPLRTAQTYLTEMRIALHRSRQEAELGEDRLKLMMNDEALRVESETEIDLLDEAPEPPPPGDLDLDDGIHEAIRDRLGGQENRQDRAGRRKTETVAFEVKAARRRAGDARAMFLLATERRDAAEKALQAADRDEETREPTTPGHVLARIRAADALTDADRQLAAARVDYQIALAAWRRARGDLHEEWHVGVEVRQ